ncbi:hypothetical protein Godav_006175 [Gossypium davidsonii]|uniref:Uncharacterized protein n=1 Tax=Gossypium davidsonii TaxID=34287 RepID=A0A7J8S2X6_GOSDV|nr:hypothetical protein [Gossypium davidsonii]
MNTSTSNQQASSNFSFGLQQEAQVSKEVAADLSKPSSASHVSLPSNRFKNFENIRVPFADSMKMAAELIASEIDGKSTMDLLRQKGKRAEFSSTNHQ